MTVNAIGSNYDTYSMLTAQKAGTNGANEARETAAQERAESPAVEAAEGEKGGTVNTYA